MASYVYQLNEEEAALTSNSLIVVDLANPPKNKQFQFDLLLLNII